MRKGIIVSQAGAWEKNGCITIPSHWYHILHAYGIIFPDSVLVCRRDRSLADKQTQVIPASLRVVLLDNLDTALLTKRSLGYLQARRQLNNLVQRADFVGAIVPSNLGNLASKLALKFNKPLFVEVAGENLFYDRNFSLKTPFMLWTWWQALKTDKKITQFADFIFYVSRYLEEKSHRSPLPFHIVPHTNIFDKDIFLRNDTCQNKQIVLFSANRVVREKGLQYLVPAIGQLLKEGISIRAVLAGDGPYLEELKAMVHNQQLEKAIEFPGYIQAGDALWQMYRKSDIMVLPTIAKGEGTPKCIIEAMASGCPVIASDVGGIKYIFADAKSGLLVQPGNSDDLKAAVKKIIFDQQLRKNMISNGLRWVASATQEKRISVMRDSLECHLPSLFK